MKAFLIKTSLFLLPILLGAFVAEYLLQNAPNDYKYKKSHLDEHAKEVETLVLGSSHSYYGIDPEYFNSATFNASHIAQMLAYDFKLLKKYESDWNALETVILPVSYFTLFDKLETGTEAWRAKNYVLYYNLEAPFKLKNYSELLSSKLKLNARRIVKYYALGESSVTCSNLGWGTDFNAAHAKDLSATVNESAERHTKEELHSEEQKAIIQDNQQTLEEIAQWCQEKGIQLMLFTPPAYESYTSLLNEEQLRETIRIAQNTADKYSNCSYLNLLNNSSFIAGDYFDADHLSNVGAKKLSVMLNNKVEESTQ